MFFGIQPKEFEGFAPEVKVFLSLAHAVENTVPTVRSAKEDKEFHFQNWVQRRLQATGLHFDPAGRISFPDFTLTQHPIGFEVKGLSIPSRSSVDFNSQMPLAEHNGRKIFYVFGRYPKSDDNEIVVHDLVLCAASFINADTSNENENTSFLGAGSYGDILTRDRRMYVCPTPYALLSGTERQVTLILDADAASTPSILSPVGEIERKAAKEIVTSYTFDLLKNELTTLKAPNPNAGRSHRFKAFKVGPGPKPPVGLIAPRNP